jgi:molecular chaperone GrpE (heat shock protein)
VYAKYPFEEGESREKWAERVSKAAQEEYSRQDGETAEAHLKRMFEIKNEAHEMAFEIMNAIAEVFGLKKVTKSDLDKVSWLSLKSFIYDILSMADIPGAEDFLPKRPGV